jgi:hypothetical protein
VGNNKLLILIIFLLLTLATSVVLVFRTTIFTGQAAGSNTSPVVLENSYLFASPLQAKADAKELIRVTVFLLDGRGLGVPNKTVKLNVNHSVSVQEIQPITDDSGKAIFDLSSPTGNKYEISATSDSRPVPQKIKVVFY